MEVKILRIVDKFRPVFEKMGVDYEVMRNILYMKLIMDGRRVPTVISNNSKKDKDHSNKNMFIRSLWIYLLMGLMLIPFIIMKQNYVFQMSIAFGIIMFMVMTSLISDFSSVILDIRDKNIIGTRPVAAKTLSMAKTVHILIYMILLTAALVSPALIISLFVQGPAFFLLFLLLVVIMDILCIILTTFVYFLVLKFFDGEKLKDIINYIQIILSLVIMVGYQMIGRLFEVIDVKITFKPAWWQYFIIPVWFSAPFEMVQKFEINNYLLIFTAMMIIIPVVLLIIYVRMMPLFEKNLQKLANNYVNKKKVKKKSEEILTILFCKDKEERIFFRFASDMMKNERDFKLKVYPSIGYSMIFPFIFMIQRISEDGFKSFTLGKSYLFIYFCGLMLPTIMMMTRYSISYKAAWIYNAMPLSSLKPVFRGTMKAYIIRIFLPVYIITAVIFGILFGTRIIPDLFVVFISMIIMSILYFMLMDKVLPFSRSFNASQQSDAGKIFIQLFIMAAPVGIHYIVTLFPYGIFIYLCALCIACIVLWETAFDIPMEKLS